MTPDPAARITAHIAALADWRGTTLDHIRTLILRADPEVSEEWKWDIPVWSHAGILCTGEVYKDKVKLTWPKGAALADPARLFNAGLTGTTRRAIDIRAGEQIDDTAFAALIRAGVAHNLALWKTPRRQAALTAPPATDKRQAGRGPRRAGSATTGTMSRRAPGTDPP